MNEKKKGGGALLGAAFLMATSAIGPGFLTQTATFTGQYKASFGFVILISIILSAVASLFDGYFRNRTGFPYPDSNFYGTV